MHTSASLLFSVLVSTALIASESVSPTTAIAVPADYTQADKGFLTPEEELALARKDVLEDRPYKIDYSLVNEILVLRVLPSTVSSDVLPDWWSEKQGYDLAKLFAVALGRYSVFKVVPPVTWDEKSLLEEARLRGAAEGSGTNVASIPNLKNIGSSSLLGNREYDVSINVAGYSFQHLPVKRRGIGLGFIALNSKECSTETYFKSEVVLNERGNLRGNGNASQGLAIADFGSSGDEKLTLDRLIVDKTGGASLNLNFLVGGAGGGSFTPPDKPLKKVVYQSAVDGAEAVFCLLTGQKDCVDYYRARALTRPSVLTAKQQKKVGGC